MSQRAVDRLFDQFIDSFRDILVFFKSKMAQNFAGLIFLSVSKCHNQNPPYWTSMCTNTANFSGF